MAKSNEKKRDFFWLSYSDLMTSLFFVMLVLFILVYTMQTKTINDATITNKTLKELNEKLSLSEAERLKSLKALEKKTFELQAKADELDKIESINKAIKELEKGGYFSYNNYCKRFELKQEILFSSNSAIIPRNSINWLINAGQEIQKLLSNFKDNNRIKFIIIIEGRAAKHEKAILSASLNKNVKDLGYSRSLSLYNLWANNRINLNSEISEVFISSSGFDGLCRYNGIEEGKNKRFIIQIIPYLIK